MKMIGILAAVAGVAVVGWVLWKRGGGVSSPTPTIIQMAGGATAAAPKAATNVFDAIVSGAGAVGPALAAWAAKPDATETPTAKAATTTKNVT